MGVPGHPGGALRLPPRPEAPAPAPATSAPETAPALPGSPAALDPAARKQAQLQFEREQQRASIIRRRQQTRDILAILRALACAIHHARAAGRRRRASHPGGTGRGNGARGRAEPGAALLDKRACLPRSHCGGRGAPQPRRHGGGGAGRGAAAVCRRDHGAARGPADDGARFAAAAASPSPGASRRRFARGVRRVVK